MKIGKLFILLSLVSPFVSAQTKNIVSRQDALSKPEGSTVIHWLSPVRISQLEGETAKTLSFEGCDNAYADRYLPRYHQRVTLRGGENDFSASLTNTSYEALTDAEIAAIDRKSSIPNEIVISTSVLSQKKQLYGMLSFIPIRKNSSTGKYEKLIAFDIQINPAFTPKSTPKSTHIFASSSVLQSGNWYKIATTSNGIYKLSYSFLQGLGIDMGAVNPQNLRIYGNGGGMLSEENAAPRIDDLAENAIYVEGEADGTFDTGDYALFYGTGPHTWAYSSDSCPEFYHTTNLYSDSAYYFITFDLGAGKRIMNQASSTATPTDVVTTFDDYGFTENENLNFIKSGRYWYGEHFDNIASYNFSFSFPNIDVTAPAKIKASIASRYIDAIPGGAPVYANYSVSCQSGSTTIPIVEVTGDSDDDFANIASGCFSFNPNLSTTTITVTKQTANAEGWMDYVEINVRRQLNMVGSQLAFRDAKSVGAGKVAEYNFLSSTPVQFWDVTDPRNIRLQSATVAGSTYQFVLPADSLRQFVAFTGASYNTPVASGSVVNQNLHALLNKNMVIVAYPDFYDEAMQLASFHEAHDTLSTVVVTPQQIYNEFSSGAQDISAIRDFMKMFYDRALTPDEMPRYLLLFGDGSYDYKKRFASNTNYVPTYQSYNSTVPTASFVSDDFYGLLDDHEGYWGVSDNDAVDIGIGRFPVKNSSEAQAAVDKILAYTKSGIPSTASNNNSSCTQTNDSPFGDWRNAICFVADDEDNDLHIDQSNQLATAVDTAYDNYNVDKIFLDAYLQESTPGGNRYPDVTDAFSKRVEKGALIINYTGHGGEVGLAHERIIEVSDINRWDNINNMPLFFTATCEFSRYDDPERTSAGEYVFLNPKGAGIALFTTVRLVFATPNFALNLNFYEAAFTAVNGRMPRLGDLYYYIKNQPGGNIVNSRNFTLLGDPALRLSYPKYAISTDTVNNLPAAAAGNDTIKALSFVTVSGFVRDKNGNILTGYNGVLYPTVYDKAQSITTLSNDGPTSAGSPPRTFKLQKNILYKGKVTVTNGYYKYSFVVPKDIAYQYGIGRISTYAENGTDDASGNYENIIIGGSNDSAAADNAGPELKLYMNDNKFAFGGLTDENPDLYAILKDDNGINTVGNGIGHDLVAILDANTENSIVLNDYYQSDLNSYKSGSIRYPFSELEEGSHTLDLKVWDVYNNSSKAYTEFIVAKSAELALKHVLNYPNPFTTKTSFYFEQNQCCQSLEVELQIFTVSGKLVKNLSQFMYAEGYRSAPIEWDGRDDFGDKIAKGVYVYRLKVKTSDGQTAEKFEKLVILN